MVLLVLVPSQVLHRIPRLDTTEKVLDTSITRQFIKDKTFGQPIQFGWMSYCPSWGLCWGGSSWEPPRTWVWSASGADVTSGSPSWVPVLWWGSRNSGCSFGNPERVPSLVWEIWEASLEDFQCSFHWPPQKDLSCNSLILNNLYSWPDYNTICLRETTIYKL